MLITFHQYVTEADYTKHPAQIKTETEEQKRKRVEAIRKSVLERLKDRDIDPEIFPRISALLFRHAGEVDWLYRVYESLSVRDDADINEKIADFVTDLFETIGYKDSNFEGIEEFIEKFAQQEELIDINILCPKKGTGGLKPINVLWRDNAKNSANLTKFLDRLFELSFRNKTAKPDAGPGELFLAFISRDIYFAANAPGQDASKKGDLIITNTSAARSVEVKAPGSCLYDPKCFNMISQHQATFYANYFTSALTHSGRAGELAKVQEFQPNKKYKKGDQFALLNKAFEVLNTTSVKAGLPTMVAAINAYGRNVNFPARKEGFRLGDFVVRYLGSKKVMTTGKLTVPTVTQATMIIPRTDSEFKAHMEEYLKLIVGEASVTSNVVRNITNAFGTPQFAKTWVGFLFDVYQQKKKFDGILYISEGEFGYFTNAEQLLAHGISSKAPIEFAGSFVSTDMSSVMKTRYAYPIFKGVRENKPSA